MSDFRNDLLDHGPEAVEEAADAVRKRVSRVPRIALILGSGLGGYADSFEEREAVDYTDIPGFPRTTVSGHAGRLVLGSVSGVSVVAQQGRFHPYEGWPAHRTVFPLRVMHALGATALVVTNAAGGVNPNFRPGDLMLIRDLVNFQFRSPLRGRGPLVDADRFVDLSAPFDAELLALAESVALASGFNVQQGTYWGNLGPTYETKAEVRVAARLGADAVGMSTVGEVVTAAQLGMRVLGITCISNPAAGLSAEPLNHQEVLDVTTRIREQFSVYLGDLLPQIPISQ